MARGLTGRLPLLAVALPAALTAAVSLTLSVLTAAGASPFWRDQPVNMSEAAALRDAAMVVRLIRRGERVDDARPIRAGLLFDRPVTLTPLEAAMAARRGEVVDAILTERGALDAATWARAACLAASVGDHDVVDVVNRFRPATAGTGPADCAGFTRPW